MTVLLLSLVLAVASPAQQVSMERFLEAIRQVESHGNDKAIGDGGKAIGPFQIWHSYWKDATQFDKTIGGCYQDCYNPQYASKVVRAYMARYAPKGASLEVMARIHNGGPKGHQKAATKGYWAKVQKELK